MTPFTQGSTYRPRCETVQDLKKYVGPVTVRFDTCLSPGPVAGFEILLGHGPVPGYDFLFGPGPAKSEISIFCPSDSVRDPEFYWRSGPS